jgi:hypothetical protein
MIAKNISAAQQIGGLLLLLLGACQSSQEDGAVKEFF